MLKDTELRVLLVMIRQTYGWNRADRTVILSYRVLQERTGRHSKAISDALTGLAKKGLIHRVGRSWGAKPKSAALKGEEQQ